MTAALHIHQLNKHFANGKHALRDINLTVQRGEMVALIGASGSGKSTLLRHVAGLVVADASSDSLIEVDGRWAGSISLHPRAPGTSEIGYSAHTDVRGKGVVTAAARLLVAHAFDTLGRRPELVWGVRIDHGLDAELTCRIEDRRDVLVAFAEEVHVHGGGGQPCRGQSLAEPREVREGEGLHLGEAHLGELVQGALQVILQRLTHGVELHGNG